MPTVVAAASYAVVFVVVDITITSCPPQWKLSSTPLMKVFLSDTSPLNMDFCEKWLQQTKADLFHSLIFLVVIFIIFNIEMEKTIVTILSSVLSNEECMDCEGGI